MTTPQSHEGSSIAVEEQDSQDHKADLASDCVTPESRAAKSIGHLAAMACAMPWEDRAPFSARYEFTQAVTPELFVELLEALRDMVDWLDDGNRQLSDACARDVAKARAAITKAAA